MNYYERHLGDYARDAGHLTMLEHGAYSILMDRYYATEQGIPADKAHRLCGARTEEERQAVDSVLADFFTLQDGLWVKARIEREIADARVRIAAAQKNGRLGGRPKGSGNQKEPSNNPVGYQLEPSGNPAETQIEAHQTPDTNLQLNPPVVPPLAKRSPKGSRLADDWLLPKAWGEWALSEKPGWQAQDVRRVAETFADYWRSVSGQKATSPDWQARWRNWVRKEASPRAGAPPKAALHEVRSKTMASLTIKK